MDNVRRAGFFSEVADKITDSSNKGQLALGLHYAHPDSRHIHEDLVDFVECDSGVTGQAVAGKIIKFLKGVDLEAGTWQVKPMEQLP